MSVDMFDFVEARLAEEEGPARALSGRQWEWSGKGEHGYPQQITSLGDAGLVAECYESPDWPSRHAEHIARQDPAATLRRVTAQRALLKFAIDDPPCLDGGWGYTYRIVEGLAAQWSDHPDYDPDWTL